jgi:selenocysteine-specific elongation factor
MAGFGTVVTGTLTDGTLSLGDEVEILPGGAKGRVRGLQTHKKKEERAGAGSRTAVNISGVSAEQIQRGEVLVHPGQYQATRRADVRMRLLGDITGPLRHASEVKVFLGTAETIASLRILGTEELAPGQEGWVQLELRDPLVAVRGDRLILRRPSPGETLGGGSIVDPHPKERHKRFDENVLRSLESLAQGSPAEIMLEAALALGPSPAKDIVGRSRLATEAAQDAITELLGNGQLLNLDEGVQTMDSLLVTSPQWNSLRDKTMQLVEEYHKTHPLRKGIPREELKSRLKLPARIFNAAVATIVNHQGSLLDNQATICIPSHKVSFDAIQQAKVTGLMRKFAANPFGPPSIKECQAEVGEEILNALIEMGELTAVSAEVIFRTGDYQGMVKRIKGALQKSEKITLAEVRDLLNTTRKYVQALLEHLDLTGVTVREGDVRKLRK